MVRGGGVLQFAETPLKGCWIYQRTELCAGHRQNFFDIYYIFEGVVLRFTHEKNCEIKFDEKMKKWKFKIFAKTKRGVKGERSNWCMKWILLHSQSISFSIVIFFILELIILCICKKSVFSFVYSNMELLPTLCCFWIFIWKIFLFTIGGYNMALTRDLDSKKYSMS